MKGMFWVIKRKENSLSNDEWKRKREKANKEIVRKYVIFEKGSKKRRILKLSKID